MSGSNWRPFANSSSLFGLWDERSTYWANRAFFLVALQSSSLVYNLTTMLDSNYKLLVSFGNDKKRGVCAKPTGLTHTAKSLFASANPSSTPERMSQWVNFASVWGGQVPPTPPCSPPGSPSAERHSPPSQAPRPPWVWWRRAHPCFWLQSNWQGCGHPIAPRTGGRQPWPNGQIGDQLGPRGSPWAQPKARCAKNLLWASPWQGIGEGVDKTIILTRCYYFVVCWDVFFDNKIVLSLLIHHLTLAFACFCLLRLCLRHYRYSFPPSSLFPMPLPNFPITTLPIHRDLFARRNRHHLKQYLCRPQQ